MFRYKRGVKADYNRQGYIYFTSRRYRELDEAAQQKILNLCLEHGGEYYQALFEFVTTDARAPARTAGGVILADCTNFFAKFLRLSEKPS